MIQGYFSTIGATRRPFVYASLQFPVLNELHYGVEFLVDTGADRTMLSPSDATRIGIDLSTLSLGARSTGVGGQVQTREIETVLTMQSFSTPLTIYIPETPLPIHSLLGRTVLSHFALFMEERTDRVLLLEPSEADALDLPLNVKS